jgi:hypothetical protein
MLLGQFVARSRMLYDRGVDRVRLANRSQNPGRTIACTGDVGAVLSEWKLNFSVPVMPDVLSARPFPSLFAIALHVTIAQLLTRDEIDDDLAETHSNNGHG